MTDAKLVVESYGFEFACVKKLSARNLLVKSFAVISLLMFAAKITLMMGPAIQSLMTSSYDSKSSE